MAGKSKSELAVTVTDIPQLWCVELIPIEGISTAAMFLSYRRAEGSQVCVYQTKKHAQQDADRYAEIGGELFRYEVRPVELKDPRFP